MLKAWGRNRCLLAFLAWSVGIHVLSDAVLGIAKPGRRFGVWRGQAKGLTVACDRGIVGSVTFVSRRLVALYHNVFLGQCLSFFVLREAPCGADGSR